MNELTIHPTSVSCRHSNIDLAYIKYGYTQPKMVGCIVCHPPFDGDLLIVTPAFRRIIQEFARLSQDSL